MYNGLPAAAAASGGGGAAAAASAAAAFQMPLLEDLVELCLAGVRAAKGYMSRGGVWIGDRAGDEK